NKTRCIPQLVAEIAVTFAALQIELDIAARAGERSEGKAQRIRTKSRNTLGEFLSRALLDLLCLLRIHQTRCTLLDQIIKTDAVDEVYRVQHITLGFGHFLDLRIADQAVDIYVFKRDLARDVFSHHNHASHPEEND